MREGSGARDPQSGSVADGKRMHMSSRGLADIFSYSQSSQMGYRTKASPTGTLLRAARTLAVHAQLAVEVLLPEFSEPHVPPVVGQRAASEVAVERCERKKKTHEKQRSVQTNLIIGKSTVHKRVMNDFYSSLIMQGVHIHDKLISLSTN